MFSVIIKNHFKMCKNRWIISEIVILISCISFAFRDLNKQNIFGSDQLIDYVFSSLSNPFFIIFIIPILYVYIAGNFISSDYESGLITSYIIRAKSRVSYYISILMLLAIVSILIVFIWTLNLIIVGMSCGMIINGNSTYYLLVAVKSVNMSWFTLVILQISIIALGLISLGLIVNIASIFIKRVKPQFIILVILVYQAQEAYFANRYNVKYSLICQTMLDIHMEFVNFNPAVNGGISSSQCVSVIYSYIMYIALILVFGGLGYIFFLREDILKE
ncbi:MAG: hypothetical protein RR620_14630 [Clostridium sp.]